MKKNLNIAYLNGAEGMIRRGGASSGGSGESGGEASSIEYLDVSGEMDSDTIFNTLLMASFYTKVISTNFRQVSPSLSFYIMSPEIGVNNITNVYFAINFNDKYMVDAPNLNIKEDLTMLEYVLKSGITQEQLDAIPRITKEQFYSLE